MKQEKLKVARNIKWRDKRRKLGLCIYCSSESPLVTTSKCEKCQFKGKVWQANRWKTRKYRRKER